MTKPLTKTEKRQRRKDRRKERAAAAKTAVQPAQGKPPGPAPAVNLCDDCAYEFGACEGIPKMASEADPNIGSVDDRVIECPGFRPVESMPTSDQVKKPAAVQEPAVKGRLVPDEKASAEAGTLVADIVPNAAAKAAQEKAQSRIERFQRDEDLGTCPACQRPLKRTALNRYLDAVRCTNPRCRQYRAIVRNIAAI